MWETLGAALALMLIMEGVLPFLYPERWRKLVERLALIDNRSLRISGLMSMALGLIVLYLVK